MHHQDMEKDLFSNYLHYRDKYDEQFFLSTNEAAKQEYGIGGQTLYLGYYCPSKVYDIIVGNTNRGKIKYGRNEINHFDYIYFKNISGELKRIDKYGSIHDGQKLHERSFVVNHGDNLLIPTYIFFDDEPYLSQFCACEISNKKLHTFSLFTEHNVFAKSDEELKKYAEFYSEKYQYDSQGLFREVSVYNRLQHIARSENYLFFRNEKGQLVSYCQVTEQSDGKNMRRPEYKIPQTKRRIE